MIKIDKDLIEELKSNSIDAFNYPKGNFWIYHSKRDGKFYGVKHARGEYYISKGVSEFTKILHVIYNCENKTFVNPSNDSFWN